MLFSQLPNCEIKTNTSTINLVLMFKPLIVEIFQLFCLCRGGGEQNNNKNIINRPIVVLSEVHKQMTLLLIDQLKIVN